MLDALEVQAECLVELVEMAFVLHQAGACQEVEVVHAAGVALRADHIGLQRFEQREEFAYRNRHLGVAQGLEEGDQHGVDSL